MAFRGEIWTRRIRSLKLLLLLVGVIGYNLSVISALSPDGDPNADSVETESTKLSTEEALTDLDPKGNCTIEIKRFCTAKSESFVDCIGRELKSEQAGNTPDDGTQVSEGCKQEWRSFKIMLYKDLSLNKKLEAACKKDIEDFCSNPFLERGILGCLRGSKDSLSRECQEEVFVAEQDAAYDFKMDPLLSQMCSGDAARLCNSTTPGGGRIQSCLREHSDEISFDCQVELFRQEMENAGDLRLNVELYKVCLNDKKKFCPSVLTGNSRVKDCLESNRLEPDFSSSCKEKFDKMLARRSADFRLNPTLVEMCTLDITNICAGEYNDREPVPREVPRIIHCLQDYRDELKEDTCKKEVHKLLALAAEDYHFDKQFSDSCETARQDLCNGVGNDKVLSCLQNKRENLEESCRSALFDMEWRLSGDIDYKHAMKEACRVETGKFCHGFQHDRGAIIDCLQQRVNDVDMGPECKKEILADQLESAKDYRLNYRIYVNCRVDTEFFCKIPKACKDGHDTCGGLVLKCLQDNVGKLRSAECKKDIFAFEEKEANNIELNVPLQTACHNDTEKLCRRQKDHSRLLSCLRRNRDKLTQDCKDEELRFSMMEASDIRLTPSLMNACQLELGSFCPNVPPTNGEAFKCLQLNLESIAMGKMCKVEVNLQEARQASDYRLDVRVRNECKEDVDKLCSEVDKNADGHAAVLKCFVGQYKNLTSGCQSEVAYAVRMALWQYKLDSNLTFPCDAEVKKSCNSTDAKFIDDVVIGTYGQCLTTKRRKRLNPDCKALVQVATTEGFYIGNSTDADIAAAIAKVNELKGGDDLSHSGIGFFWVTTVVAFVALLAVALFRRYSGPPRTYTLVVKGGDL